MDSEAVFDGRLKAVGLWEFKERFVAAGFLKFGDYACATTTTNGNLDDDKFAVDVLEPILGRPDHVKRIPCKRLFLEAFAMFAADLSKRASGLEDEEKPRKIPTIEKGIRLKQLRADYSDYDIEDELEPSHLLIDKFWHMYESGDLRYLLWTELTRRDAEVGKGVKKDEYWKVENGAIRSTSVEIEDPADISTESKLRFALMRRLRARDGTSDDLPSPQEDHAVSNETVQRDTAKRSPKGHSRASSRR